MSEREGRAVDSREGDMDDDDDDNDDDDDDDGANGVESGDENNTHFSQEKSAKTQSTS